MDRSGSSTNSIITKQRVRAKGLKRLEPLFHGLRMLIFSILLFTVCVSITLVVAFAGKAFWMFVARSSYFTLAEVNAFGLSADVLEDLKDRTGLKPEYHKNLFLMDEGALERVIMDDPRIRNVHVKKQYPRGLYISAEERKAAAVVLTVRGDTKIIDEWGNILGDGRIRTLENSLPYITGVPSEEVVNGKKIGMKAMENVLIMLAALRQEDRSLYNRIAEAHIDEAEGLTVYLRGGMKVNFGQGRAVAKLPQLTVFLENSANYGHKAVDLSFENQMIAKNEESPSK